MGVGALGGRWSARSSSPSARERERRASETAAWSLRTVSSSRGAAADMAPAFQPRRENSNATLAGGCRRQRTCALDEIQSRPRIPRAVGIALGSRRSWASRFPWRLLRTTTQTTTRTTTRTRIVVEPAASRLLPHRAAAFDRTPGWMPHHLPPPPLPPSPRRSDLGPLPPRSPRALRSRRCTPPRRRRGHVDPWATNWRGGIKKIQISATRKYINGVQAKSETRPKASARAVHVRRVRVHSIQGPTRRPMRALPARRMLARTASGE